MWIGWVDVDYVVVGWDEIVFECVLVWLCCVVFGVGCVGCVSFGGVCVCGYVGCCVCYC